MYSARNLICSWLVMYTCQYKSSKRSSRQSHKMPPSLLARDESAIVFMLLRNLSRCRLCLGLEGFPKGGCFSTAEEIYICLVIGDKIVTRSNHSQR